MWSASIEVLSEFTSTKVKRQAYANSSWCKTYDDCDDNLVDDRFMEFPREAIFQTRQLSNELVDFFGEELIKVGGWPLDDETFMIRFDRDRDKRRFRFFNTIHNEYFKLLFNERIPPDNHSYLANNYAEKKQFLKITEDSPRFAYQFTNFQTHDGSDYHASDVYGLTVHVSEPIYIVGDAESLDGRHARLVFKLEFDEEQYVETDEEENQNDSDDQSNQSEELKVFDSDENSVETVSSSGTRTPSPTNRAEERLKLVQKLVSPFRAPSSSIRQ